MATVETPHEINLPLDEDNTELNLVALTMAALRFVNPWSVDTEGNSWSSQETAKVDPKDRIITLAEVNLHDSYKDCWVVIYDRVYEITNFFHEHPGGADIMLEYAGRDASTAFRSSGHSRIALKALDRFLVGELPMHERMYRRPGGMRLSDIPE